MAGFNLPPGCSVNDIPGNGPMDDICQICGLNTDKCECPECPVCQTCGDPACYKEHGMQFNEWQNARRREVAEIQYANEQAEKNIAEAYDDPRWPGWDGEGEPPENDPDNHN